jgi:sentrin-specific protease 8
MTFRHYDSMSPHNHSVGKQLAKQAESLVAPLGQEQQQQQQQRTQYLEVDKVPQQKNGYDCGLYLLAVADQLTAWLAAGESLEAQEAALPRMVTQVGVTQLRSDLLQLISEFCAGAVAT